MVQRLLSRLRIGTKVKLIAIVALAGVAGVEQQAAATRSIARSVQDAAVGTEAVNTRIGNVCRISQNAGAAAEQRLGASSGPAVQASAMQHHVETFTTDLQAA